jgi:hypothetical protein
VPGDRDPWAALGAPPGLCVDCVHPKLTLTRRGSAYLRCLRAEWDDRLSRYPRLPVLACVGHQPPDPADRA